MPEEPAQREAADLLRRHGLAAEALVAGGGVANAVWLTSGHVVRINGGRFRDAFAFEAEVLRALPQDIPRPVVVAQGRRDGGEGEGEYLILERLPGVALGEAWPGLTTASRRRVVRELARIVRRLHALPPAAWMANPWVADALAGRWADAYHAPPSRFPDLLASARHVQPSAADVLDRTETFVEARLDAFAGDVDVPVHADLHFANVLVDGDRVPGLVDFEGFRLAPADTELDMLLRDLRGDLTGGVPREDAASVTHWFREVSPEPFAHPRLVERLEVYQALWQLVQLHHWAPDAAWAGDPALALATLLDGGFRARTAALLG